MRQGSNARRARGRPHRRQSGGINKNANFDSNGPEGRVRGNANQVYEKYINLARDATSAGDRILAESFYQFAEHYYRIVNDSMDPQSGQPRRQDGDEQGHRGGQQARFDDEDQEGDTQDESQGEAQGDAQGAAHGGGRGRRQRMNGRGNAGSHEERRADQEGNADDEGGANDAASESPAPVSELPGLGEQPSLADAIDRNDKEAPKPRRRGRPRKNQDQEGGPVSA